MVALLALDSENLLGLWRFGRWSSCLIMDPVGHVYMNFRADSTGLLLFLPPFPSLQPA